MPPAEYETRYYERVGEFAPIDDAVTAGILPPTPIDDQRSEGIL